MARQLFKFNHHKMDFTPEHSGVGRVLYAILKYFLISLAVAFVYYCIFALFYDTKEERVLAAENKYLSEQYHEAQRRIDLLDNTAENIWLRDIAIYREVFNSELPDYVLDATRQAGPDYSRLYRQGETALYSEMSDIVERSDKTAANVSRNISLIFELLGKDEIDGKGVPSAVPLLNFSIGQTGASVGEKFNPFFKTLKTHEGIDIVAPTGMEVLAPADGTVRSIKATGRRDGACLTIEHKMGYTTQYKHLGSILVRPGQNVKRGNPIARIGSSGRSFAPHLHYEVRKNDKPLDPTHYFFSTLGPQAYNNVTILGFITGQTLD